MTKQELINRIQNLIDPDTTPDPEFYSDGEILDMIQDLLTEESAE